VQGAWDLIEIGDDVSLNFEANVSPIEFEAGMMILGGVKLGNGVTLDVRAGVSPFTTLADNVYVVLLSLHFDLFFSMIDNIVAM
jgi:hypothetical protein